MDHLQIFIESSFYHASDFLIRDCFPYDYSEISEDSFMAVARSCAGNLSDDALRLVYRLYEHDWNHLENDNQNLSALQLPKSAKIFRSIFEASEMLLNSNCDNIKVKYKNLFKWREATRLLGEDIFITAHLAALDAYSSRKSSDIGKRLAYPPTLQNDNHDIEWILSHYRLHKLHTHLRASSNVFNINWTCLMNHPESRLTQIEKMLRTINNNVDSKEALRLNELLVQASVFRCNSYRLLHDWISREQWFEETVKPIYLENLAIRTQNRIQAMRLLSGSTVNRKHTDYIHVPHTPDDCKEDFSVYLGERYFLYLSFLYLIRNEDHNFTSLFRQYILIKSTFRKYLIQLNKNHGFANFKRYQDIKGLFVSKYRNYSRMLTSLPIADAWRDSNIAYQEVRIVPEKRLSDATDELVNTVKDILQELNAMVTPAGGSAGNSRFAPEDTPDFGLIYHFIKLREGKLPDGRLLLTPRNHNIRKDLRARSYSVLTLFRNQQHKIKYIRKQLFKENPIEANREMRPIKAIDAASSEFNCRPEAFGQAFRFLKKNGLKATYHAGEDFYDIADGIRSIDEAVTFLGLTGGDRIGHAIAMGVDPYDFYERCARHIIVPAQWMLDNVAWLLFRSADWNITLEPAVESFLKSQYHQLFHDIYGQSIIYTNSKTLPCDVYYQSLLLRSDNPDYYRQYRHQGNCNMTLPFTDSWENFELLNTPSANIARNNDDIRDLYCAYHFDHGVRERGDRVIEFKVCKGYARLIEEMQNRLMCRLENRHIVIESCPSSNVLIGSMKTFRKHPAFRFYSADRQRQHNLKVTLNTDDLGVFQTSLANEYSYMALALEKEKDENGNQKYSTHDINEWLLAIAKNGEKCRF